MRILQYVFFSVVSLLVVQSHFKSGHPSSDCTSEFWEAGFADVGTASGLNENTSTHLTYNDLREYRFGKTRRSAVPPKLKALDGKMINIAGYMIPLNEAVDITEFMLIQYPFFGCCYSVPPEPNETVLVSLPQGKSTEYVNTPIRVTGRFCIDDTQIDGYVVSLYRVEIAEIQKASANDPDVKQHLNGGWSR
ncbi:conserved hypothetical protein [Chloroherpeton thalassium ATCC 35110]|uniref:DUF3299 domain-containing protein n=1 Tax=Chloroherpeton thalassium (strain ATCC 35110 / GB-78) TaxID=517418 RepID=B3QX53_CHLT3|nr:DUF3299 domain-containing protein [Chloroherpeton thalassium]ACF14863.1 conserved hypothetical protein [Chloroherpeton thalassium ATCC 35110]